MGEKKIHCHALPDYPAYKKDKENDKDLIEDLHALFDEADILIAHNGDRFDIRKANARFIMQGLKPPSPYKSIDTLKAARRFFHFQSNKLDDLGQYLGCGRKLPHTGFDLWKRCMAGERGAWKTMREYNMHDVELLERVYEKLKPYISNHPDLTIYTDDPGCPTCRSTRVQRRGFLVARKRKYRRYHCQNCGSWFQGAVIKAGDHAKH
jgi:DNA polymerase elongation subunit (family B)